VKSLTRRPSRPELVDFGSNGPFRKIQFGEKLGAGGVTFVRSALRPNPGAYLASPQISVIMHEGAPFRMDWREPGSDKMQSSAVSQGCVHVTNGEVPAWLRWEGTHSIFTFAIDRDFVEEVWQTAFHGVGDLRIVTSFEVDDPVVKSFCELGQRELALGGPGGRLYAEGLATSLAVHLLRAHRTTPRRQSAYRGGLAPGQLRRVVEYVSAHLTDSLGLAELAALVGLSTSHFGEAFKTSVGTSPHRYVMERRVEHAHQLLRDKARPIEEIASAVGFSSQSHLTTNFRRVTGVTPGRFRRSLG
jgi:AraC family transcriptional regulator